MEQPLWWHVVRAVSFSALFAGYAIVVCVLAGLPLVAFVVAGMWQLGAVFAVCVAVLLGAIVRAAWKVWRDG